jgi:hypothetical protein
VFVACGLTHPILTRRLTFWTSPSSSSSLLKNSYRSVMKEEKESERGYCRIFSCESSVGSESIVHRAILKIVFQRTASRANPAQTVSRAMWPRRWRDE